MAGEDFSLQLDFDVPPTDLYGALATEDGIRGWWTRFCLVPEEVGAEASFRFPEADFYAVVRIEALEEGSLVEWQCVDSKHPDDSGFVDLHDWVGTRIRFEIESLDGGRSRLRFRHLGLTPLECAEVCTSVWSFYLGDSLRGLLERGEGKPYPQQDESD